MQPAVPEGVGEEGVEVGIVGGGAASVRSFEVASMAEIYEGIALASSGRH